MKTLDEELDEALGIVKKKDLHPPMAPKFPAPYIEPPVEYKDSMAGEKEVGRNVLGSCASESVHTLPVATNSKPAIDFSYLSNNSSFQRAIMEFIKKFVPGFENVKHRGSKEEMAKSFDINAQNYRGVMNEFKEKVKRLRE